MLFFNLQLSLIQHFACLADTGASSYLLNGPEAERCTERSWGDAQLVPDVQV